MYGVLYFVWPCCSQTRIRRQLLHVLLLLSNIGVERLLKNFMVDSGPRSMLSFNDLQGMNGSKRLFFQPCDYDYAEMADGDLDEYLRHPEKKRRLTSDQVCFLERSFDEENKLEPDRKIQLAKDLGLSPRQVAVWFQNRRARWKTKQLEKDFEVLQSNFNSLTAEYETLLKEKDKLEVEVVALKEKLGMKEREAESSQLWNKLSQGPRHNPAGIDSASDEESSKLPVLASKQEHIRSSIFEHDQSDLSQDEDDSLSKDSLVAASILAEQEYSNSGSFEFSGMDHAFWYWSY
ncbi:hypothetical protein SAY86_024773 [Trapa natans]|uniref:Homeobox-leucine zipper protein n=1 Tax=Trapa natans TaxID=22666 RepID=A0AAN7LZS6_TRANT|nr:hypothetical protein SAY86_024773 [Trapa natans]